MIKLRDEDKKLLLLIIIIGLVIFTIVFLDFLESLQVLADQASKEPELSAWEELIQDITLSPKNESDAFLRESVSKIFSLMNERDYEEMYQLLSADFKEEIFPSQESFESYMERYAPLTYSPKYTEYEKYDDTYILKISFLEHNADVTTADNTVLKSDYFCIRKISDTEFTFSLSGFIGNKDLEITDGNDKIKVTLTQSKLTRSFSSFVIKLENLSEKSLTIPSKKIYTVTGLKPKYYNKSVLLGPNSAGEFEFTVYTGQSLVEALPADIYLTGIMLGEETYSFTLPIEYCIDI